MVLIKVVSLVILLLSVVHAIRFNARNGGSDNELRTKE